MCGIINAIYLISSNFEMNSKNFSILFNFILRNKKDKTDYSEKKFDVNAFDIHTCTLNFLSKYFLIFIRRYMSFLFVLYHMSIHI